MDIGRQTLTAGKVFYFREQERCTLFAVDPCFVHLLDGLCDSGIDLLFGHRVLLRDRISDEHTAFETAIYFGLESRCQFFRRVDTIVHAETAVTGIERRQFVGAVADDRYTFCLQVFER